MNTMNKESDITLQVPAQLFFLPAIGHFAKDLFSRHPFLQHRKDELSYVLELIVYESCANVIRHAYPQGQGQVLLKIWFYEQKIIIQVIDFGPGFDPDKIPLPNFEVPQERGMGLYIIRKTVDKFNYSYSSSEQGNVLHMEKDL
jgi:serine/threonine-protein kinase RsbW